jgi:hypothetical protein
LDQQHDGVALMVESICGQGFAYVREVEEGRQNFLVKLGQKVCQRRLIKNRPSPSGC